MESDIVYSEEDWNEVADIPLLHMSYLIHVLLPRRHFGAEQVQIVKRQVIEGFTKLRQNCSDELQIVPVGSKSEGYSIPDAVRLTEKPYLEYLSDIDAMLVRHEFRAAPSEFDKAGTKQSIFVDTSQTRPGYGRICFSAPRDVHSKLLFYEKDTEKYFLSSSMIMQGQLDLLDRDEKDKLNYYQQGPAISSEDPIQMTFQRGKSERLLRPQDYVLAIPCDGWPKSANSWASRTRSNDWLAKDVIDSIVSAGFYMVPIAHKSSTNPEVEWRISFAKAEQILAEQAVTAGQRQCYVYLKILRKQSMNEVSFSSYCLKNVFLYCCETLPLNAWVDDPSGCVLHMLDILIECVQRKHIPSYFLPENNLIAHLSEEDCYRIECVLQSIREDPIAPVLEFTDSRIFCFPNECLSYSTTFRSIVQFVLDEIASAENIDVGRTVLGCFTDVQCNIASVMLAEKRSSFLYHVDFYQSFVQKYVQMAFADFVNYMGIRLDSPFITLMFYEKCLAEVHNFPDLEYLRGNMACMCFALALTHDEASKERKMRLYQAEKLYKEVLNNNGVHFASTIDFANFLCYNERWKDVTSLLEQFIKEEENMPTQMKTGYYPAESTTLSKQLQREVKHTGCFLASSLSFAYYFLIKAYIKSQSSHLPKIVVNFEKHCQSVENYGDYELLGYSGLDIGDYELAEMAFFKAINLHPNNHLAEVNLNLCRVSRELESKRQYKKMPLKYLLIIGSVLTGDITRAIDLMLCHHV